MPPGPKPHPVWNNFNKSSTNGKNVKATCKFCGTTVQAILDRVIKHANVCESCAPVEEHGSSPVAAKKRKIDQMIVRTSREEAHELDKQIAKVVFATNSPFSIVENKQFQTMTSRLRPGYKGPNRRSVSNQLLDEVYEEELEKSKSLFEGKSHKIIFVF